MKVGVLFSGGKDSCLAFHKAFKFHEINCLINLLPENPESYMFHSINAEHSIKQAEATGLPLIQEKTLGKKEEEIEELKKALIEARKQFGIKGIVTGAIRSVYQSSRIQKVCADLGIWCFNPLWLRDEMEILHELVEKEFKVVITGIFAFPLDEKFLGKELNHETLKELEEMAEKHQINPAGEGGEIETFVLDAPFFRKKLKIINSRTEYKNNSGKFFITETELCDK